MIYETTMESPVGPLRLRASDKGLTGIYFSEHKAAPLAVEEADGESPILALAREQLQAYFDGSLQQFDLPLDPSGTPFQLKVWETLRGIGFAETASYGQLAEAVGSPKGARAVGLANSLNPLSIVVPCHRVVGSSGKLTGYAGGLASKQWLLEHEQIGAMAAFL